MSIILSLIIDIGCLDPNSNVETGLVKSSNFELVFPFEISLILDSSNFAIVIFLIHLLLAHKIFYLTP